MKTKKIKENDCVKCKKGADHLWMFKPYDPKNEHWLCEKCFEKIYKIKVRKDEY